MDAAPAAPSAAQRAAAAGLAGVGLGGVRVLVIDDDPRIAAAMETLLGGWGCRVVTAGRADDAVARVRTAPGALDLIIADYHLAEGPVGVEAVGSVQALLPAAVPAIVITADRSAALRQEIVRRGYPVLHKPVKPAPLRAMITHLVSTGRRHRPRPAGS